MQLSVRDVNEKVFREFKAQAVKKEMKVGEAITLAMELWMRKQEKKVSFFKFKPVDWGKGTENLSQEIDEVLYG